MRWSHDTPPRATQSGRRLRRRHAVLAIWRRMRLCWRPQFRAGAIVDAAMLDVRPAGTIIHAFWRMARGFRARHQYPAAAHIFTYLRLFPMGKYISIAAIEPQFYALLLRLCGIDRSRVHNQMDSTVPDLKQGCIHLQDENSRRMCDNGGYRCLLRLC